MSLADIALGALSAEAYLRSSTSTAAPPARVCPFPHQKSDVVEEWLETGGLQCSAGKREFRLGRYFVSHFRTGAEFNAGMDDFRRQVADGNKTGFLALFHHDGADRTAAEELRRLGAVMQEAGMTDDANALVEGKTLSTTIEVPCPVTGKDAHYEFFSVAFCRNSGNPGDPLYDPSLSAPFTAVNTTSDAYAFGRLVHDQCVRFHGCAPHELVHDRDALELLFRRCVTAWQNMSITTIDSYSRVSVDPARGVHLSEDRKHWFAAHNDPVFAEMKKCPHVHEMPITYAARLTAKWSANLFDGKPYEPSRDGQSGGVPVPEGMFEVEGLSGELFQF